MAQQVLSKQVFMEQLFDALNDQDSALYRSYLNAATNAGGDPVTRELFPNASEPLKTPEFTPEKPAYTMEELQAEVDKLEKAAGYEKLVVTVGGVVLKLAMFATASRLTGGLPEIEP